MSKEGPFGSPHGLGRCWLAEIEELGKKVQLVSCGSRKLTRQMSNTAVRGMHKYLTRRDGEPKLKRESSELRCLCVLENPCRTQSTREYRTFLALEDSGD